MSNDDDYVKRFPDGIKPKGPYTEDQLEELISFNHDLIERMNVILNDPSKEHLHWVSGEEKRIARTRILAYRKMLKERFPKEELSGAASAAAAPAPSLAATAAAAPISETQAALVRMISKMTPPPKKSSLGGKGRKLRRTRRTKKSSRKSK